MPKFEKVFSVPECEAEKDPVEMCTTPMTSTSSFYPSSLDSCQSVKSVSVRRYLNSAIYTERIIEIGNSRLPEMDNNPDVSSIVVPPLELDSSDDKDSLLSLEKSLTQVAQIRISPNSAYENWRLAKRAELTYAQQRKKKERQKQLELLEERKRLNDFKVKQWLELKNRKSEIMRKIPNKTKSSTTTSSSFSMEKEIKIRADQYSEDTKIGLYKIRRSTSTSSSTIENDIKLRAWLAKKEQEAKEKRKKQKEAEEKARRQAEERKRMSEEAFQIWLSKSASKPKPVPLNKGFDSLRGTINAHYWNPNEWVHPTTTE